MYNLKISAYVNDLLSYCHTNEDVKELEKEIIKEVKKQCKEYQQIMIAPCSKMGTLD